MLIPSQARVENMFSTNGDIITEFIWRFQLQVMKTKQIFKILIAGSSLSSFLALLLHISSSFFTRISINTSEQVR